MYDGEGHRVRKLVGENTRFVHGLGGELIAEFDGSTGNLRKEYVYGGGSLITIEPTAMNSNGTRYTVSDHLGLRRMSVFTGRYYSTILTILLVLLVSSGNVPRASSRSLDSTQLTELEGVEFVVPHGFQLEQQSGTHKVSFMRNRSESLGLFVTVLEQPMNDKYLTELSKNLVSRLRHEEDGFRWKLSVMSEPRVSKHQRNGGTIKGLNGNTFVQIDYIVVRAQDKDVIIGSIAQFGEERTAPFLFEVEGREYSVNAWRALFQLISSVTGEKGNGNPANISMSSRSYVTWYN